MESDYAGSNANLSHKDIAALELKRISLSLGKHAWTHSRIKLELIEKLNAKLATPNLSASAQEKLSQTLAPLPREEHTYAGWHKYAIAFACDRQEVYKLGKLMDKDLETYTEKLISAKSKNLEKPIENFNSYIKSINTMKSALSALLDITKILVTENSHATDQNISFFSNTQSAAVSSSHQASSSCGT